MEKLLLILLVFCLHGTNASIIPSFLSFIKYVITKELNLKQFFDKKIICENYTESYRELSQGNVTISTTSGDIVGSTLKEAYAFYSVPYAAPPIGKLRFRDTKPVIKSSVPIDATTPKLLTCRQFQDAYCLSNHCIVTQNENCLVLSVFVPRTVDLSSVNPGNRLPVLLWIHGGAFIFGAGTCPKTDGRWLSNATNTIVVTINYRIGAYGFLVYNKGSDHLKGNQGIKDQQMAMKWVQQNIENFGGDKEKVTIFGESAGAQSVMFHMLSEVSRPLYERGILESNPAVFSYKTPQEAMSVTERLLNRLKCSDNNITKELNCLLTAPAKKLDEFYLIMEDSLGDLWSFIEPYRPVIDGFEFTDQPLTLFKSGKWNVDKTFIIGANTQELEAFPSSFNIRVPKTHFSIINSRFFGGTIGKKITEFYKKLHEPIKDDFRKILGKVAGDVFFICPSRAMARLAHTTAKNPNGIYFYIFDHPVEGKYCQEIYPLNEKCGTAYHTAEIPFVFRSGDAFGYHFNNNDILVADQFSKYWGNFARVGNTNNDTGGPSFHGIAEWPAYTQNWPNIHIESPSSFVEYNYKNKICDFVDSLHIYGPLPNPNTCKANIPPVRHLYFLLCICHWVLYCLY